ncbi:MAG: ferritin-like domain-containing protein [Gaiellales bacterium]
MTLRLPPGPIETLPDLRLALQMAIELEHAAIPPYLCALYSMAEGRNAEAAEIIQSVAMEEMLHLTLAANVLNAIGGNPSIDHPEFVPRYPAPLPGGGVLVSLARFSRETIGSFLRIERPERPGAQPEATHYQSIAQFYAAIEEAVRKLAAEQSIFSGDPARQVHAGTYIYGTAGDAIAVRDLDTALQALELIVDQGEGFDATIHEGDQAVGAGGELAHYFRFQQIALARRYRPSDTPVTGPTGESVLVDWDAAYPMRANLRLDDLPVGSEERAATEECNGIYTALLRALHVAFNGRPEVLIEAVPLMLQMKDRAVALMKVSIDDSGATAGPTFEWMAHG